ncbi:hypothetical protein BJX64DRAFT_156013 [Aspergillus heterothallicus]
MPARPKSRITTACNSCRTRKQKCSGNRPACIQCLQHRRNCDWPEQLKRGPAKGYIDALEHRLQETESLLMGLLEQVTDSQLSSSIPHAMTQPRPGKRGSEYWKRFPLRSVEGIRSWQEDTILSAPGRSEASIDMPNHDLAAVSTPNVAEVSSTCATQEEPPRMQQKSPEPQASLSLWSGAPSTDFQQRFLW